MESKERREKLLNPPEAKEVMELENFLGEDLLRASNDNCLEYLGPLTTRRPRMGKKEREQYINSKKQKIKKA